MTRRNDPHVRAYKYIVVKSKKGIQSNSETLAYYFLNFSFVNFSDFGIGGFLAGTTPVIYIFSFLNSFLEIGLVENDINLDDHPWLTI